MKIEGATMHVEKGEQIRVLVTGSHTRTDDEMKDFVFFELDRLHFLYRFTDLAHGAAAGVDTFAGEWAKDRDVRISRFPANWKKYGSEAGPRRNQFMYDTFKPHHVVVFPGGPGTAHMRDYAIMQGSEPIYANP
jgi:hypothetical protein